MARFSRTEDGKTLYQALHELIPAKGIKQKALIDAFAKKHKQWRQSSAGPALSYLARAGLIRRDAKNRLDPDKMVTPLRPFRPTDEDKLAAMMSHSGRAAAPHRGGNGAIPFTSTKFMVAVGEKDTVVLDGKQAYALWKELNAIFGGRS